MKTVGVYMTPLWSSHSIVKSDSNKKKNQKGKQVRRLNVFRSLSVCFAVLVNPYIGYIHIDMGFK